MINSKTIEYYHASYGSSLSYLSEYIANKSNHNEKLNYILIVFLIVILISLFAVSKPIFAQSEANPPNQQTIENNLYLEKNFKENIKNKYQKAYINFPSKGIAHIKKTKYINKKPIKINIVEIDTKVNTNLKIKPETASEKLNSKKTIRKIAQRNGATIAINGGYFKPQTGVPLGALMIDRKVLTGPIFNRVGIAIFEQGKKINFKMDYINFDIKAYNGFETIKIDNINQPRMLSTLTLLYTPDWGKQSPIAPKNGYNLLIVNNKIEKISANPIEFKENSFIIQAPKPIIQKIAQKSFNVYIDIKLQKNLQGATHIIGAGPYLIKNSEIFIDTKEQKLQAIAGKNPRSAIGYTNEGRFIIVTIDGREKTSVGMTLNELARLMKEIGCDYAMNFDGGSSSALYINGKIENQAINKEGIAVSNALIVSEGVDDVQISSL